MRLLKHIKVTPDLQTVEAWLGNQTGNWISFWPFFTVTVEKCLATRTSQVMSRAVQALYIEIVDEVNLLYLLRIYNCTHFSRTPENTECYGIAE